MQYKEERFYTTEMTGQELTKKTNSKIGMLKLTIDDLPRTVERNQLKELKKIATFTENKLEQIQELKWHVQEAYLKLRVELKKSVNGGMGRCQLKQRLEEFIQGREELEATIEKLRITEEEISRTEDTEQEAVKLQKRTQEELKIVEAKVKTESRPRKENQRRRKKRCETKG